MKNGLASAWPGHSITGAASDCQGSMHRFAPSPLSPRQKHNFHVTTSASRWRDERAAKREDSEQEAVGKSRTERWTTTRAESTRKTDRCALS